MGRLRFPSPCSVKQIARATDAESGTRAMNRRNFFKRSNLSRFSPLGQPDSGNRFKLVNDTLGHDAGNAILTEVSRRLVGCVREADTVSREGGDEFVVILPDLERPENARIVADKIIRELARPVAWDGLEIRITTSIDISHYPNDSVELGYLLKHADSAMYEAKDAGRNTVRFFTSDPNQLLTRRLELESRLHRGIENQEFFLRYQPQIDISTGRVAGMEALIRWNDPAKGEVSPIEFISIAEELGLLGSIPLQLGARSIRNPDGDPAGGLSPGGFTPDVSIDAVIADW